ncbi:hypothetical protein BC936DRAFT_143176 [Jimgerdemannia flammicorona]|uniref:PWI domain-containing protein n=1 Tax=Jimgerdemannia flammicorona TaxID=994334 RepID=A0A433DE98_9FUNG|nr:hypothetical protein BC936DRAFT_143176 [Jimgerdemannia flammicorona]
MREREREQQQQQQQRAANGETGTGRGDVDATSNGVDASMAVQPLASATDQTPTARRGKFNFNLALKRRAPTVSKSGTPEEDEDDEENAERKKRRVLVPLNYDDDDLKGVGEKTAALLVTQEVSAEERRRLVTELVDEIRAAQDGVWKWNVKWDELDELLPFVAKQIVDLLGVQEDELTSFVMDHVRNRRTPEELVTELEMEAPNFVMKLWRRLIFETESKHRKL